jgi:hypothetical protein
MRKCALLFVLFVAVSCVAAPPPRVRIRIFDETNISAPELQRATSEATQRLAEAGIGSEWVSCRIHSRKLADPRCEKSFTPSDLVVNLVPRSIAAHFAQPATALAFTATAAEPRRSDSWIVYDSVRALGGNTGVVLGNMIAHELGELLRRERPQERVMLASWSAQELADLSRGRFHYSPNQAAEIRAGLDRRWDARDANTSENLAAATPGAGEAH